MSIRITKYGAIRSIIPGKTIERAMDVYLESGPRAAARATGVHETSVVRWAKMLGIYYQIGHRVDCNPTDWIERGRKLEKQYGPAEGNCRLMAEWTRADLPQAA